MLSGGNVGLHFDTYGLNKPRLVVVHRLRQGKKNSCAQLDNSSSINKQNKKEKKRTNERKEKGVELRLVNVSCASERPPPTAVEMV